MNGRCVRGLGFALAGVLVGCASGGDKDSGGADAAVTCETDFTHLATAERVSLRDDVMPIFGLSCTMSSCHGGDTPAAKLYLGVRCVYDENSPHRCTFPDSLDGAPWPPDTMPLTAEGMDRVYSDLLAASGTAPSVPRVTPGDPAASFLVDKIRGTHNNRGYDCVSSSPVEFGPCGSAMPFGTSGLCGADTFDSTSFNTIAAWVLQGARNE
jgi:hypothetical protein